MKHLRLLLIIVLCCTGPEIFAQLDDYKLRADGPDQLIFQQGQLTENVDIEINGDSIPLNFDGGQALYPVEIEPAGKLYLIEHADNAYRLYHLSERRGGQPRLVRLPFWLSVLPPLIAIGLALAFREVIVSLFMGIWAGAFIAGGLRIDSFYYFFLSLFQVVQKYVIIALEDADHLSVIVFSLLIGGMVAIISRNGGMAGIVNILSRYARSTRSTQFITWVLGVAIFFDDYANTLIVGNTMRSVTDRFHISREKLAYIVDSTAAPVAAVAFITTWIGAELGYIGDGVENLEGFDFGLSPYAIFVQSLRYSFYPIFTLAFILILIYTRRDYGAMFLAERRARSTGDVYSPSSEIAEGGGMEDLTPLKGVPIRWYNAFFPVLTVILVTIFGLLDTGFQGTYDSLLDQDSAPANQSWSAVWSAMPALLEGESVSAVRKLGLLIGNSNSYVGLLWGSLSGVLLAVIMTLAGRIMKLEPTIGALMTGLKTMLPAVLILTLAWSLAATTKELNTAEYLTSALGDRLNPFMVPPIIFILAAFIAFSTGSSWSTMAILYPIAIPTTWYVCQSQGLAPDISLEILLNVIAGVLAASVMGDHCSPISDTTILSSLASDCNHIDHVRTQLPYALTVGLVSITAGGLSTFLGGGWLISALLLLVGLAVLLGVVLRFGKKAEEE